MSTFIQYPLLTKLYGSIGELPRLMVANYSHRLVQILFRLVVFALPQPFWLVKNYEHWRTRSNQFKINFKLFTDKIKESRRQKLCTDHLLFYSILQATQACIFFNRCNKQYQNLASEKFLLPSESNMTLGLQGHTLVSSPAKANQP